MYNPGPPGLKLSISKISVVSSNLIVKLPQNYPTRHLLHWRSFSRPLNTDTKSERAVENIKSLQIRARAHKLQGVDRWDFVDGIEAQ